MDQVLHRHLPEFVWPTVGHPGRVPLDALVPDPKQSRKFFGEEELKALAETMKAENDGEQREILTVRALTAEENATLYPLPARYMIVSGERRWRAAPLAGLIDIEIRVKKYKSRAFQMLDGFMLNGSRVGLSDIENAHAIADLAKEFGWQTQEEIANRIGEDQNWVSQHLALLKLSPKAQALLSPDLKEYQRLARGTGVFMSRLSLELQDDFAERMPQGERVTSTQQIRWIQEELKKLGVELPKRKFKPGILRQLLCAFTQQIERRAGEISKFEELDCLFENATLDQAQEITGRVIDAQNELEDLVKRIQNLLSLKEASLREAKVKAVAFLAKRDEPKEVKPPLQAAPKRRIPIPPRQPLMAAIVPKVSPPVFRVASSGGPVAPVSTKRPTRTFNVFDDNVNRVVTKDLTRDAYVKAWDAGKLGFQHKGQDKPDYMPTREGALGDEWNN